MNTVLAILGSNSQPEINLIQVLEKLSNYFDIISIGSILLSKPEGVHYINYFHNQAIKLISGLEYEATKATFKQIETEMGRTKESKQEGLISIDIDLIFWNDKLMHKDYERFHFVKKCIDEIR